MRKTQCPGRNGLRGKRLVNVKITVFRRPDLIIRTCFVYDSICRSNADMSRNLEISAN